MHVDELAAGVAVEVVARGAAVLSHSAACVAVEIDVGDPTARREGILGIIEKDVVAVRTIVEVVVARRGRKVVGASVVEDGFGAGGIFASFEIESGDGRAAAIRALVRLVKQID